MKELKAFQKVTLKPGETQTVTLTTDRRALSFWDEANDGWKAEPGKPLKPAMLHLQEWCSRISVEWALPM